MENGKTKLIPSKLIGPLKTVKSMATMVNIFTSMFKNGKTNRVGGAHLFREMSKSTLKK